jgi:hypothetical protein
LKKVITSLIILQIHVKQQVPVRHEVAGPSAQPRNPAAYDVKTAEVLVDLIISKGKKPQSI